MAKQRMRRGENPREPEAVVLRTGELDENTLRRDAEKNFEIYGFYGLSVWVPGSAAELDALLANKLKAAAEVIRFAAGDLYARGLDLWDTGQYPHYDGVYLVGDSLDGLVAAFLSAPRTVLVNQRYDPEGDPER